MTYYKAPGIWFVVGSWFLLHRSRRAIIPINANLLSVWPQEQIYMRTCVLEAGIKGKDE